MAPWYQNAYETVSVAYVFILQIGCKDTNKIENERMKEWKNEKKLRTINENEKK